MSETSAIDRLGSKGGPVLRATALAKRYAATTAGEASLLLFREISLSVAAGELVAIVGRSGAGKSSLLHLLAGLERPDAGEVWIGRRALHTANAMALAALRNRQIGYVWQFHYLLPEFSALENIALPLLARGVPRRTALGEAAVWLQRVGLADRTGHRSGQLSGGEQQRVALARALVTKPEVLLADEPTGDLDDQTSEQLFTLLEHICREEKLAAVVVTHNLDLARRCDRTLRLAEGVLQPIDLRTF